MNVEAGARPLNQGVCTDTSNSTSPPRRSRTASVNTEPSRGDLNETLFKVSSNVMYPANPEV